MLPCTRRGFLSAGFGFAAQATLPRALLTAAAGTSGAPAPSLATMIRDPLLKRTLYRKSVSNTFSADGAAGANCGGYRWIEEQRQGAEWIVRGTATDRPDWIALGWSQLDWGLRHQLPDGSFASEDGFHSTSFFVEALARACLLDASGASRTRVDGLARAAHWLMLPEIEGPGARHNQPFTHRRYILAAAFGQSARVTGERQFALRAEAWATEGLSLQEADGTNPEKGGLDISYQMVGVLMALRYLPVCGDAGLRAQLRGMIRRATARDLTHLGADGSIDAEGSTRIGHERSRAGVVKTVAYGEILQALVFGALALPEPKWLEPAQRIASFKRWDRA